nr:hypothetical protein [Legionella longbeachae]
MWRFTKNNGITEGFLPQIKGHFNQVSLD